MDSWGAATYGDPCRGCGFGWSASLDEAVALVARVPAVFDDLLEGATGAERRPDLAWSVGSYVCHVGDNLRIWAERLAGIAAGGPAEVGGYDENALAAARQYDSVPLVAALWSLGQAVEDWVQAVDASERDGIVMIHPVRGELTLTDVTVANAHDAVHHRWDIETTLAQV